ncbi:MAG: hypothetical protein DWI02_04725 [Planctomycetota bacterium]|nr:MAG: hypothetical protein DWI02_04725 [Planctomycetota bacterium]
MKHLINLLSRLVILAVSISFQPSLLMAQPVGNSEPSIAYDQVQPVFKKHCVSCHGLERERGDLNLSSIEGIHAGSSSGPVAVPGKPDESLLYTLSAHLETPRMPPGKAKIPQRELDLIRNWIEGGMKERAKSVAAVSTKGTPDAKSLSNPPVSPVDRKTDIVPLPRRTSITALAVSPQDGRVAVPGVKQVLLFDEMATSPVAAFPFPEGAIFSLRFSPDGAWLLAGGGMGAESGKVVVFEVATGRRLFEIGNESDVVLAFDVNADRSLIAMGGPGRVVNIYRTAGGGLVSTLRKHTDWILSMSFSPDGLLLASGDRFGAVQVWEAQTGKPFFSLRGHTGAVNSVTWADDSEKLLSGGQDGFLRIWNMHDGSTLNYWNAGVGGVLSTVWTKQNLILAGGRAKQIAAFEDGGKLKCKWSADDEVVKLATNAAGTTVITGDAAGNVSKWSVEQGESIGKFELPIANSIARVEPPAAVRKPRTRSPIHSVVLNESERELADAREALASTEAAVKATEESLSKLKVTAESLRRLVSTHENAVKKTVAQPAVVGSDKSSSDTQR